MRVLFPAVALGALAVSLTSNASAFCRTKACDNKPAYDDVWQEVPDPPCTRDAFGCPLNGTPLHWPATCISFDVQRDGSKSDGVDFETASAVINEAFTIWQNADCGGMPPSLVVRDHGAVVCNKAEYNQEQPNANLFTFRDGDWPYKNAEDTLALTTITYNTETAEIYDADVEINSFDATFTVTDDTDLVEADLLSVLTHEVGHFLGLSHAPQRAATMYPEYTPKDTHQRTLDADDQLGICDIYPPGRTVGAACEPRHGFSSQCAVEEEGGCGVAPGPRSSTVLFVLAPLGVFFALWRARRRRTGR
jgi:MYXO-CTERM domain-containing protein